MTIALYLDSLGVRRVWGEGATEQEAIEQANLALAEYRKHRPEMAREHFTLEIKEDRK